MHTEKLNKIDRHIRLVAAPVFAMFVMTVVIGYFAFVLDPAFQQALPLVEWPLLAKATHYLAPWYAVASAFCAGGLCANSLGEWTFSYFTSRRVVIAVLVLALITMVLVGWVSFAIVDALLAK
uniref:Transmembrane protein n=1 Tax=Pseudomonas fluorescens (strain SBW25) TaxID=216595 RepID=A4V7K6_PSEFS|nr:hypothetical protein [Pseudomonas fluorescens]CAM96103.1 putative transmembrane protein [Pseudomonas fluorescens SBW25]